MKKLYGNGYGTGGPDGTDGTDGTDPAPPRTEW